MNEHRNHRRLAGAALVTFCTSTLCGLPAVAATGPADSCALLTQSQVSAALGVGVDPGKHPVAPDPLFCNWREQGKPEGPARNVIVTLIDAAKFEREKTSLVRGPKTPEPDIGDEAYYYKAGRFPFNLIVKKGAVYFRIMVRSDAGDHSPAVDDQDKKVDRALAIEILKKL